MDKYTVPQKSLRLLLGFLSLVRDVDFVFHVVLRENRLVLGWPLV